MLHHVQPRLFIFVWCTCLNYLNLNSGWIWFEFHRENKNKWHLEIQEKWKKSFGPKQPSYAARTRSPWRVGPACQRQSCPRALTLSLSVRWGQPIGANFPSLVHPSHLTVRWVRPISADRSYTSSLSLAHGPHLSAPSASLTSRSHTVSWTRPRRASPSHIPTRPTPLLCPHPTHSLPSLSSAPLQTSRTSLSHSAHPRSTNAVHHDLGSVPRPSSSLCRVRCSGELHLLASDSRQTLVCPYPLYSPLLVLTGLLVV
jgi:hypothetical protein